VWRVTGPARATASAAWSTTASASCSPPMASPLPDGVGYSRRPWPYATVDGARAKFGSLSQARLRVAFGATALLIILVTASCSKPSGRSSSPSASASASGTRGTTEVTVDGAGSSIGFDLWVVPMASGRTFIAFPGCQKVLVTHISVIGITEDGSTTKWSADAVSNSAKPKGIEGFIIGEPLDGMTTTDLKPKPKDALNVLVVGLDGGGTANVNPATQIPPNSFLAGNVVVPIEELVVDPASSIDPSDEYRYRRHVQNDCVTPHARG